MSCKYCTEYEDLPEHIINGQPVGGVFDTCLDYDEHGWHIELPSGADIGIKFCPYCGRELMEETFEKKYSERAELRELVEHLNKYERCRNCYHLASCDAWVRNATTLYDDYVYSVENCPYYVSSSDVVEVRHGRWINDGEDWFCNRCNHNALCDKMTGLQVASAICPHCGAKMDGGNKDG